MIQNITIRKILFFLFAIFSLMPMVDAPMALILGVVLAVFIGNPFPKESGKLAKLLLKVAIVGLGFGMNLNSAIEAGKDGLLFTISTIVFVLVFGWVLGKLLKVDSKTSYLVSSGTAICGGSAIAAVAGTIDANEKQISVALGTVFVLNSIALLMFPAVGNWLELSQQQFGIWSAIAIHDTSSVVGAAHKYGEEALELATVIKLGRALWIIPLALVTVFIQRGSARKVSIPYFIGFFILAMLIYTLIPKTEFVSQSFAQIVYFSKRALVLTLFLIGAGLSLETLKSVGPKTFLQGVILWAAISIIVLIAVLKLY